MPMALIAGYGINELATSHNNWERYVAAFLVALAFGIGTYQSVDLNFFKYDDNSKAYIYAHTKRDCLNLVREVDRIAKVSGKDKDTQILIVSPDYWGLPWYFRDYKGAAFYGKMQSSTTAEMIIGSQTQDAELKTNFSSNYIHTGTYALRPGVDLQLWVRKDLAER
jgi:hypothetical protein